MGRVLPLGVFMVKTYYYGVVFKAHTFKALAELLFNITEYRCNVLDFDINNLSGHLVISFNSVTLNQDFDSQFYDDDQLADWHICGFCGVPDIEVSHYPLCL